MSDTSKGILGRVVEANSASGQDALAGGDLFKRHTVKIPVPVHYTSLTVPEGVEHIDITLRELTPSDETKAAEVGAGAAGAMGAAMTKSSLFKFGIGDEEEEINLMTRDFVWERLGMKGRQTVATAFATHFTADEKEVMETVLGKAEVG